MGPRMNTARLEAAGVKTSRGAAAGATPLRAASPESPDVESPARRLQLELEQSWSAAEQPRWSTRRALSFIVLTNLALWAALIAGARALS